MSILKDDIQGLKEKLESIEKEYNIKMLQVDDKGKYFDDIDKSVREIIENKDSLIDLNIGGRVFRTKISTILSVKDTLFYKIIVERQKNNEKICEEIFLDRNYDTFPIFLDYLRTRSISTSKYSKFELDDICRESLYYGFQEINEKLEYLRGEIEFISFTYSGRYSTAGTDILEDLKDRSLKGGICALSPGWIIIELNSDHEFDQIEVGGWNGNTGLWYPGNGASSSILTSLDNATWTTVGTLPSNYGAFITTIQLMNSLARYIKFQSTGYLGLGFLNIIKKK